MIHNQIEELTGDQEAIERFESDLHKKQIQFAKEKKGGEIGVDFLARNIEELDYALI